MNKELSNRLIKEIQEDKKEVRTKKKEASSEDKDFTTSQISLRQS